MTKLCVRAACPGGSDRGGPGGPGLSFWGLELQWVGGASVTCPQQTPWARDDSRLCTGGSHGIWLEKAGGGQNPGCGR